MTIQERLKPTPGPGLPSNMNVVPAPRRMRIALIYGRMPLPMTRADQMTVAHLISYLSARGHDVDLFTLDTGEPVSPEQLNWLRSRCREIVTFRQSPISSIVSCLVAMLRQRPMQVGWFTNPSQISAVHRAIAERHYDIAYTYYIRSAEVVRGLSCAGAARKSHQPVTYLAMQLSQALNTKRIAERATRWTDRIIYSLERHIVRRYEAEIWKDFTRTVLISPRDVEEIRDAGREYGLPEIDNFLICAHGVDIARFFPRPEMEQPCTLVFSGVMATNTNINAVLWFVQNCWASVKKSVPNVKFLIVGRSPAPEIRALASDPAIIVTGEVPDPADYIARAEVCINPMQAGAGMQNKLIEYLASGKAVVATPVANEGVGAKDGEQLVEAATAEKFAEEVVALLGDPSRRARLGRAARAYIESHWTWEKFFGELESDMLAQSTTADK